MTTRVLARLADHHAVDSFACGEESLDRWLRNEALSAQRAGASQTHVWTEDGHAEVLAYFALALTMIQPEDLDKKQRGGINGQVPGILIAKLALCESLRGQGLGADLLVDALRVVVQAADRVGGRFVVVDAINPQVHAFYEQANFLALPQSMRLIMKVATARAELSALPED